MGSWDKFQPRLKLMIEIYFNLESRLLLKLISIIWIKSIWDLWFFGIPTIGLQAKMAAWIILIIANKHSFSKGPTNDNRKFLNLFLKQNNLTFYVWWLVSSHDRLVDTRHHWKQCRCPYIECRFFFSFILFWKKRKK